MKFMKLFSVGVLGVVVAGPVLAQGAFNFCTMDGACRQRPIPASSITDARVISNYSPQLPSAAALRPILDQLIPQLVPVAGAPADKTGTFSTGIFGGQISDGAGSTAPVSACVFGFGDASDPRCPAGSGRVDFSPAINRASGG